MSENRKYLKTARWHFSIHFVFLLLGILFVALLLFGYYYVVSLSLETGKNDLQREEKVLSEIILFDQIKNAISLRHPVDSTKSNSFKKALFILESSSEFKNLPDTLIDNLNQISDKLINDVDSITFYNFTKYQKELHKKIIHLRSTEWTPDTSLILKKIARFIGIFLLCLIVFTPFMRPLLDYLRGKKLFSKWLLYGITFWILLLLLFLVMTSSGRIPDNSFLPNRFPFAILTTIIFLLAVITSLLVLNSFFKNINDLRKLNTILITLVLMLLIICSSVMLVMIVEGVKNDISGRFINSIETNTVVAEKSNLLIFALELAISIMFLILFLVYSFFPTLVFSFTYRPGEILKEYSRSESLSSVLRFFYSLYDSIRKWIIRFAIYNCWGWNRHYSYYIKETLTESGIQVVLGLVGSIIMLLLPFLFSSAGYFTSSFLLSPDLYIYNLSEHIPLVFVPIAFVLIFFSLKLLLYRHGSQKHLQKVLKFYSLLFGIFLPVYYYQFYLSPSNNMILIPYLFCLVLIWLWVLSNVFDSGKRNWIIFFTFLIPFFYLFLINLEIFPKILKHIEISPGILSPFFGMQTTPLSYVDLLISLSSIIPLFLLWASPVLVGLEALDSKFAAQTSRFLRWIIQHLKEHTIVLGYGDLGKKVGDGIVRRIVIPMLKSKNRNVKEEFSFVEILSTRRQIFVDLCTDFIIVDKNSEVFDEIHPDPDYGIFGISDVENGEYSQTSEEKPIVLLGLVGDCKDPAVHDDVNLEFSKIIIFTGRDEEAIFPLFNEIYKHHQFPRNIAPSAIISVDKRVYGAYLEWRCVDKNIYFVYPPFLRGTIIGEMISEDMLKQECDEKNLEANKVLILGRGNQLFYTLLVLQEDLQKFFYGPEPYNATDNSIEKGAATEFIENNVSCVSDEEHIKQKSVEFTKRELWDGYLIPSQRRWLIHPLIGLLSEKAFNWDIRVFFESPSNSIVLRSVLQLVKPDVIVIASASAEETTTITMELLLILERARKYNGYYKPHIIVGSRKVEWHQIRDALACWRAEIDDGKFYPVQEVDTVVDFYDDATNMIINLREALAQQPAEGEKRYIGEPVEISRCATRVPYGLAEFLSVISNFKFSRKNKKKALDKQMVIPTFHNYRSINMKSSDLSELTEDKSKKETKVFCFTSGITAVTLDPDEVDKSSKKVRKRLHLMIVSTKRDNLKKVDNILSALFEKKEHCLPVKQIKCSGDKDCIVSQQVCPKKRLCPIDISVNHADVLNKQLSWEKRIDARFSDHCMCNCLQQPEEENSKVISDTYAQISICGYGGENYGAIARAINLLVLRDQVEALRPNAEYVIDLKYERSFTCYHPARNYFKFYGNIVKWEMERLEKDIMTEPFINAVLIRPTTEKGFHIWLPYARSLFKLIENVKPREYSLFVAEPHIILLFRRRDELFKKIRKELVKFHSNLQGITLCKDYDNPDLFLCTLRGYEYQGQTIWKGICNERETSCPFKKIQDESRNYQICWSFEN